MSERKYVIALVFLLIAIVVGFAFVVKSRNKAQDKALSGGDGVELEGLSSSQVKESLPDALENSKNMDQAASYKRYSGPPKMELERGKKYSAVIKTTKGDITVKLFQDEAPVAVNNFVFLSKEGFYNGTIFHRTIKGFMIQGGDPLGNGTGGPGYKFADESISREYKRGILAMANSGPNTNGSQFFIMHQDYPLPKNYVIFGEVSLGIEAVDQIAQALVRANAYGENSTPVSPVSISSVSILEN